MAKEKWVIVKEKESGKFYPTMYDRDLKWVSSKDGFVNQNGVPVDVVYNFGKIASGQIDSLWAAFRMGIAEGKNEAYPSLILQNGRTRYTFSYDKSLDKYDKNTERMLVTGSSYHSEKISVEKALKEISEAKENGFLEFRNPKEVSWYATVENNTPFTEEWTEKNGFLIPIQSDSVGVFSIDGISCEYVSELENGEEVFVLGKFIDDKEFYCAFEKGNRNKVYEFDHHPTWDEVENAHANFMAEQAINSYESEFGADGFRTFPWVNEELKMGGADLKNHAQILKDILKLAKEELQEEGDSIGYNMPDGKYHLFIYVDETDEKVYVVEPNRVENGAHEPFVGNTYLVEFGDFGELMVGCTWAMECFDRDKVQERELFFQDNKDAWLEAMIKEEISLNYNCYNLSEDIKNIILKDAVIISDMAKIMNDYMIFKDLNEYDALDRAFNESFESKLTEYGFRSISLKEFLHYFDFEYQVMMPDEPGEKKHRENLLETEDIGEKDMVAPLLALVDSQGGNFGNIEGDRFRIDEELAEKIVDRMNVYIEDSITTEFMEALHDNDIMTDNSDLEDMVRKAKEIGIGSDEVNYRMAACALFPHMIDVSEVIEKGRQGSMKNKIEKESLDERIGAVKGGLKTDVEAQRRAVSRRMERE